MRALRCLAYGEPETLVIEELATPRPGRGEVLVEVAAAAVNHPDVLVVRNRYQRAEPVPFTPGSDFAGIVRALGDGVTGWVPGARVCGTVRTGAFAEALAVGASMLMAVPDAVALPVAAAFPVAYTTAWGALRAVARVQPGETVLVLGAAGGVGSAALELAQVLGARVVAAAAGREKVAACRARGADAVVDYAAEDLKARVKDLTRGGAQVVIDLVGGPYAEPALRALAPGGRFVVVGFASGEIPRIPLNLLLLKGVEIRAYEAGRFFAERPDETQRGRDELLELLAAGRIHPHVAATYPLAEGPAALRAMAERRAVGKLVIEPHR